MKPSEIRKKLHQYLDEADGDALQFINEAVVAYKAKSKKNVKDKTDTEPRFPILTNEEIIGRVERSEENLKNGRYYTEEEMERFFSKLKSGKI